MMHFFSKFFKKAPKAPEKPRQQSEEPVDIPGIARLCVKRYCRGKCTFRIDASASYPSTALEAVLQSAQAYCTLHPDSFRSRMQKDGVPETVIEAYLNSYRLDDDAYLHPGEAPYLKKLYGRGKCYLFAKGPVEYSESAYEAFSWAMDVVCRIKPEKFHRMMVDAGVPEAAIERYLDAYVTVDDELYWGSPY